MAIAFYKLLDLLNRSGISKTELRKAASLSADTMSRIINGQNITTDTIDRICRYLGVQPGDIMEYVKDESNENSETIP